MRALVTGGAGFIGSSITRALLARGDAVVVLDDFSTGRESNLSGLDGALSVERGDIRDDALVAKVCSGVDAVFHQAAMPSVAASIDDPLACDAINVRGTLGLLETARKTGVRRVVFAASAAAYGDDPELPKLESMRPAPLSPYAVSKVAGENYMRVYAELYGMQTLSLRYFNVFGPRQDPGSPYSGVISVFVDRALSGARPTVFGDGEQSRDFVYVGNVVQANLLAGTVSAAAGRSYNVGCGEKTTLNELLAVLGRILGQHASAEYADARPGDIRESIANVQRARDELGYAPDVGLEEGLRRLAG